MKKFWLFLLVSCLFQLDCVHASSSSSRRFVDYPGRNENYSPHESLIESVEAKQNNVKFYVDNFGPKILLQIDPVTQKNVLELALNAGNYVAAHVIEKTLRDSDVRQQLFDAGCLLRKRKKY